MNQFLFSLLKGKIKKLDLNDAVKFHAPAPPVAKQRIQLNSGKIQAGFWQYKKMPDSKHWILGYAESSRLLLLGRGRIWDWRSDQQERTQSYFSCFEAAYCQQGETFLKSLNGKFAFVLYDKREQTLFAFRDPLGYYQLFFSDGPDALSFSSHLAPLIRLSGKTPQLSPEGMLAFFQFGYTMAPYTLVEGIQKLFPSQYFCVRADGRIRAARSWAMPPYQPEERPMGEWLEIVRSTMGESIEKHLNIHSRSGVFLSGGIDSSIVAGYLAKRHALKSYTFGINIPRTRVNYMADLPYARLLAKKFRFDHHEYVLDKQFDITDILLDFIPFADNLLLTPNIVTKYFLSQQAHRHGVAQIFTGSLAGAAFESIPRKKFMKKYDSSLSAPEILYRMKGRLMTAADFNQLFPGIRPPQEKKLLHNLSRYFDRPPEEDLLQQVLASRPLFQGAEKAAVVHDLAGWPHLVDIEIPFMERDILEMGTKIPIHYKSGNEELPPKFLLKEAFKEYLPAEILEREIIGFPSYYWNSGQLDSLQARLMSDDVCRSFPFLSKDAFQQIVAQDRVSSKKSAGKLSWTMTVFLLWYSHFILKKDINQFA